MKRSSVLLTLVTLAALLPPAQARVITVTTTNNASPPAGAISLQQALASLQDGDTVSFNIPGTGPFYIATPTGGYPIITNHNITLDGYSQPGAQANSNPILAANNAKLMVVLDSRNGNFGSMNYDPSNSRAGYGDSEFAILGVLRGTNVTIKGLCLLGAPPQDGGPSNYGIAFACDPNGSPTGGRVSGCWIGVAPNGKTLAGMAYAITAFRHRDPDGSNPVLVNGLTIGVSKTSTNAPAEFNVIVQQAIPIIIEGNGTRISGNFLGVLPDGVTEYNVAFDPVYTGDAQFEGAIEIGRGGNNTLIGTDGDGVNDANERNVICGTVPNSMNGYDHTIEFYGNSPGTNIVIAGNYIGVGVDGHTYFTNGVPAINASGGSAQYRIGSNLDGVSDSVEANLIVNNWPSSTFPAADFGAAPTSLNFFDELSTAGIVSLRGNSLRGNFPYPVSPAKADGGVDGAYRTNFYAKALVDATLGIVPVLSTNSPAGRLVGTYPIANTNWPVTIIDLYAADPVGITNGQMASIAELPYGFVQGAAYLGSFDVKSAANSDPTAGKFSFGLGSVDLQGALLTATANYLTGTNTNAVAFTSPFADPVAVVAAVKLSTALAGAKLTLSWPASASGYTLESKAKLTDATWTVVGTSNPTVVTIGPGAQFFRLRK